MLHVKRLLVILACVLLTTSSIIAQTKVPEKERRIYLWDVSGSLLSHNGKGPDIDRYTGDSIKARSQGNGLWMTLKDHLWQSIDKLPNNEQNEIIVIPFYAEPLTEFRAKADSEGKKSIINSIKEFKYPRWVHKKRTNITGALSEFEKIVKTNCCEYKNYMFLYTDGLHEPVEDQPDIYLSSVIQKIDSFNSYVTAKGRYIYRFYCLVSPDADPGGKISKRESDDNHFWVIKDLNVNVNLLGLGSLEIDYNICDNPNQGIKKDIKKVIPLNGDCKNFSGKIVFNVENNEYYNVECELSDNKDSVIIKNVYVKNGVNREDLPEKKLIKVQMKSEQGEDNHDKNIILDNSFEINCINIPERSLSISLTNQDGDISEDDTRINLGTTEYHPRWLLGPEKLEGITFSMSAAFNNYAELDNSSLSLSFVDNEGKPVSYDDFKIVINKKDTLSTINPYVEISKSSKKMDFQIIPSTKADDSTFKGFLLISNPNELDRVNGVSVADEGTQILPWKFVHNRRINPLLRILIWILGLLVCLLLFISHHRKHSPRFPSNGRPVFAPIGNAYNIQILPYEYNGNTFEGGDTIDTNIFKKYIKEIIVRNPNARYPYMPQHPGFWDKLWNGDTLFMDGFFADYPIYRMVFKPTDTNDIEVRIEYDNQTEQQNIILPISEISNYYVATELMQIQNTQVNIRGMQPNNTSQN